MDRRRRSADEGTRLRQGEPKPRHSRGLKEGVRLVRETRQKILTEGENLKEEKKTGLLRFWVGD